MTELAALMVTLLPIATAGGWSWLAKRTVAV